MRAPEHALEPSEPQVAYEIGGQRWNKGTTGFEEAVAQAHEQHLRPRCLCQRDTQGQGIEMYVARLLDGYIVKRMPNTGSQHATACPSYEPPADLSGLGQLLGTAILENPSTGTTTLKLDFPMTKMPGRSAPPPASSTASSASSQGNKLTLRSLLHYLWDQAELTRWQPSFTGKRSWATVRRHLLRAAENKVVGGHPLLASLYIPEVFSVENKDAITARRLQQWTRSRPTSGSPQPLMLMIVEVKEIVPARYGHKAVIKHVPDQPFGLDDQLYRRLARCFEQELALWSAVENLHMLMIATFRMTDAGLPNIVELSLMPATAQWHLIEDHFDRQLLEKLVGEGRSFIKCLRYNAPTSKVGVSASLTDCGASPHFLIIERQSFNKDESAGDLERLITSEGQRPWVWNALVEPLPKIPVKGRSYIEPLLFKPASGDQLNWGSRSTMQTSRT
ncbi:DUF1173 domain-containing protein [Hydrogenophaga sp.]|uniref:DUF1173 domain-containing protein n=1 Tax=Hydrogenophaga sp. TaxID=1904254 RepID=UPI002616B852|nr:DUF1173 domain-containing protein [Hydrogenophaga sp.]